MAKEPKTSATGSSKSASGGWVALIGTLVVALLYFYYQSGFTVYSLGWLPGFAKTGERRDWNEYLIVSAAALLWIPILYIILFTSDELEDYGFAKGDIKTGWMWAGLMFAAMLIPLYIASKRPEFQAYYPIQKRALYDTAFFFYFELTYGFYLFCWEFFFRGFLTFGLYRWIGYWGVVVQAVAFMVLHIGKPPAEVFGSFIAAGLLAWVALRSKSFLPAFWVHWAVAFTFDLMIVLGRR